MSVYLVPGVFGAGGQVLDSNGKPASGALVNTYAAGTTSTVQVFTTSVGNVAAANPVVCNSDGRLPYELWQTSGQSIKIIVTDALVNILGTYDNLTGVNDPSSTVSSLSSTILNLQYNNGVSLIRELRNAAKSVSKVINGIGDGYQDQTGVNTGSSTHLFYDSTNKLYEPTRSGSQSTYADDCSSFTGWSLINITGATPIITNDPNRDPTPGNLFDFLTNATIGAIAGCQKDVGTIPANYGLQFIVELNTVGTNALDALTVEVGNISAFNLQIQLLDNSFSIFQDGSFRQIIAHGGNFFTEWWVQVTQVSGASHQVDVYAGTQLIGSRTGNLPGGATDGLVVIQQKSGATNNRESRISIINIGTSQLADNITLISNAATALTSPTKGRIVVILEDTSVAFSINSNFNASLSQNGVSYEATTLTNAGIFSLGIVDNTKNVYMLVSEHVFTNIGATSPSYKLVSTQNWWFTLLGTYVEWS